MQLIKQKACFPQVHEILAVNTSYFNLKTLAFQEQTSVLNPPANGLLNELSLFDI